MVSKISFSPKPMHGINAALDFNANLMNPFRFRMVNRIVLGLQCKASAAPPGIKTMDSEDDSRDNKVGLLAPQNPFINNQSLKKGTR
mmetsp:Transcript_37829/g.91736  ORF Transcript_37829/g.91736 Transcript_37829/m.91736 type:complete len:87 (-) Transcript_37829:844-1104(-)